MNDEKTAPTDEESQDLKKDSKPAESVGKGCSAAAKAIDEVSKALTSAFVSLMVKQGSRASDSEIFSDQGNYETAYKAGIAGPQPRLGSFGSVPGPVPVPTPRPIHNDLARSSRSSEVYKSCVTCGRMCSTASCIRCDSNKLSFPKDIYKL